MLITWVKCKWEWRYMPLVVLYLASYTFPFFSLILLFFWEAWMPFMFFFLFQGDAALFCNHYLEDFGMMDMYMNNPRRWINLNFLGGTKFEQAHNAEDSYGFEFVCMALEWVLAKLSIRSCLVSCFWNKNFQDFESRASLSSCYFIIESNKQAIKRS